MMKTKNTLTQRIKKPTGLPYLNEVIFHVLIGFAIFSFKSLALFYTLGIFLFFILKIIKNPNNPMIILQAAAYMMAAEVFLRMTDGLILYETGKYAVILFVLLGLYFHNFHKSAYIYIIYLILLIPGVLVTYFDINYQTNFRKTILFNLSGPFCLFASALFCYKREVNLKAYLRLLDIIVLPIITMSVYLFLYTPNLQEVVTSADANFAASGGFGPNQVSTILGLGIFCLFVRIFLTYQNRFLRLLMYGVLALISYRALVTLSRGGVFTSVIMCAMFLVSFFRFAKPTIRLKAVIKILLLVVSGLAIWSISLIATNQMLYNKYTDRNAKGVKQGDITTGRIEIAKTDFEAFIQNPILGIGVGMGKFYRSNTKGLQAVSHNEITRLISEHGMFGILSVLLLISIPIFNLLEDHRNIFILPFMLFWLLTVSHSSMRVAAPGFIYGLALLKVKFDKS